MGRTCYETEEPRGERTIISNVRGVLAQEFCSESHQVVKTTSGLQGCRSRNHRGNDQHHIDGHLARMHTEDKDKDEDTYHTVDTQSDASDPGTDEDTIECRL